MEARVSDYDLRLKVEKDDPKYNPLTCPNKKFTAISMCLNQTDWTPIFV